MKSYILDYILLAIVIIGALNWGLVGLFDFILVDTLFGTASSSWFTRLIYILVGVSAVCAFAFYGRGKQREQ